MTLLEIVGMILLLILASLYLAGVVFFWRLGERLMRALIWPVILLRKYRNT